MGSKARTQAKLPGPPMREELAYLAGLLDQGGGIIVTRYGAVRLQVRAPESVRKWLFDRMGGYTTDEHWACTTRADQRYLLTRVRTYTVGCSTRIDEVLDYLDFLDERPSYHGSDEWRAERDRRAAALRA